jgi:hypothetical protein
VSSVLGCQAKGLRKKKLQNKELHVSFGSVIKTSCINQVKLNRILPSSHLMKQVGPVIEYPCILNIHKTIYLVQHNSCLINGLSSSVFTDNFII